LTIDRPLWVATPQPCHIVPDLEQFVYNFVRHLADKTIACIFIFA